MTLIEELRWRGLIHDTIPGIEAFLEENQTAGYLGVDPTADSIHIGNLVPVMMLVHLQRYGHRPVALVGGATGRVGDPSGKDKERQLLSEEQVNHNAACVRKQLAHFLDFDAPENGAQMVNNYDWFENFGFIDFLRDVGKHITISYMLSKESVKKRLASDSGLSYTEFAYQLLQGYDFFHLYKHHNVRLQVGGSDQWGNITTGTELIRRMLGSEAKAYAAVCPLLTSSSGAKLGKTAGGENVWLDPARTSPYQFFQYWLNLSDDDGEKCLKIFSLKSIAELEDIISQHAEDPGRRNMQRNLAEEITERVHGAEGLAEAQMLTDFFFGRFKAKDDLNRLSRKQWEEAANSSERKTISRAALENGIGILDLFVECGITQSKGEARRAIEKDKSVKVNLEKIDQSDYIIKGNDTFLGDFLFLQKGKRHKYIVEAI
ncbi:MAG: tyrosine--tRNA ligase [Bacteroidota bacterium]